MARVYVKNKSNGTPTFTNLRTTGIGRRSSHAANASALENWTITATSFRLPGSISRFRNLLQILQSVVQSQLSIPEGFITEQPICWIRSE